MEIIQAVCMQLNHYTTFCPSKLLSELPAENSRAKYLYSCLLKQFYKNA